MTETTYQEFVVQFQKFLHAHSTGMAKIESEGNEFLFFAQNISDGLERAHLFEIDDNVKDFLASTRVPKDNTMLKLPFPVIFLNVRFTKEDLLSYGINVKKTEEICGIIIRMGKLYFKDHTKKPTQFEYVTEILGLEDTDKDSPEYVGDALRITTLSKLTDKDGQKVWFDTFNREMRLKPIYSKFNQKILQVKASEKSVRDFVHHFVLSFLNFCNTPHVEYIEVERSEKNKQKRLKRGLIPLPNSVVVKISDTMRKYIYDKEYHKPTRHFGYQFDVRGYWRHYRSDKYVNKKGMVDWVKASRRGSGIYIEKIYQVEKEGLQ